MFDLESTRALADLKRDVVLVGVRHHSPACARHVQQVIETCRPKVVLIEGPSDFTAFEALQDPELKTPVALFSYVAYPPGLAPGQQEEGPEALAAAMRREENARATGTAGNKAVQGLAGRQRYAGWYPFCDYSPEWVAIQTALQMKIPLSFCDLSLHGRCVLGRELRQRLEARECDLFERSSPLFEDFYALLRTRLNARDDDDVWDRLFELQAQDMESFARDITAFGVAIRASTGKIEHSEQIREETMAAHALRALQDKGGQVVLVCGAYHVAGIDRALRAQCSLPDVPSMPKGTHTGIHLLPYQFQRMSRLEYTAGMPMPQWYQMAWEQRTSASTNASKATHPGWLRMLSLASRKTREQGRAGVNTAAFSAASEMAMRLAGFRGHASPSRIDVLDAIGACWVKGDRDTGHGHVLRLVEDVFRGDREGEVGPQAGVPPLVRDVENVLQAHHLDTPNGARELRLRPIRDPKDKQRSRILSRLGYLGVSYARLLRGPDFTRGEELHRVEQAWWLSWTPEVRASLVTSSVYGGTLEDAVAERLRERIAQTTPRALASVARLMEACALGLHEFVAPLLQELAKRIDGDAQLPSVLGSLHRLVLLYLYRDALGTVGLPALGQLIQRNWERAMWLLGHLGRVAEADEPDAIAGLRTMDHAAHTLDQTLDVSAFYDALASRRDELRGVPGIHGAVEALLWRAGRQDVRLIEGSIRAHCAEHHADAPGRFLAGLLSIARRAYLDDTRVIRAVGEGMTGMEELDFRSALPRLRRVHAMLTPDETSGLARRIAGMWGGDGRGLTAPLAAPPALLDALQILAVETQHFLEGWGLSLPESALAQGQNGVGALAPAMERASPPRPTPTKHPEMLRRWRLVLGHYADALPHPSPGNAGASEGSPSPFLDEDHELDRVLAFLYDREYGQAGREQRERPGQDRKGGRGASALTVPTWINQLRELFPQETYERLESEALERYGLAEMVTQADVLERCTPSLSLLEAILRLKHMMSPTVLAAARRIVREVAESLREALFTEMQSALSGRVRYGHPVPRGQARNFDPKATIHRNLRYYDPERKELLVQKAWFRRHVRQYTDWRVIVCVDQSGSMLSSTIHAGIVASVFASIQELHTHLVVFDTAVVDLTDVCEDPVETLLSFQLGGGTDIAQAVGYCQELIEQPARSIVVLITDLYEGGDGALLIARIQRMIESGVKVLVLAALDDSSGEPDYDRELGRELVGMGVEIAALTPRKLVQWIGEVLG